MQISLSETGKRFNRDWIFRKFSYQFNAGNSYAITGPNGSGKSTLLQVIGGAIATSEGAASYMINEKQIDPDDVFRYLSFAAPYQELIEEMTLVEFLEFHRKFKPLLSGYSVNEVIQKVQLTNAAGKQIRYYSSGMKQRAKLAQAFFSDTSIILLDEPCTNLDADGIALYSSLIDELSGNRIVIVSSNDLQEYGFCKNRIDMNSLKQLPVTAGLQ
jgi:ABC-type multidrug transport system ATPase subunit